MRSTKKGFTLVELLVVIAILAILATVSVVGYTAFIDRAHQSVAMQEMTQIRNALVAEDINNHYFNLADGIDGEGVETVYAADGEPAGAQSEAYYVLEFVKELGIAGTFRVSNKQLQFSPAGRDATATCDFVTGEISTAKGALEDNDQSTEPVVCPHANVTATGADATCTEPGFTTSTCDDCGEIVFTEEIPATGHTPNEDDGDCTTAVTCQNCDHICVEAKEHVTNDIGTQDCTASIPCTNEGCQQIAVPGNEKHTPGTDDGDCTTAIQCSNEGCQQIAVEAMDEHEWNDTLSYNDVEHWSVCATCGTEGKHQSHEGLGELHIYDCTTPMTHIYHCYSCDYSSTHEMPAPGHKEETILGKAPTCTEPGFTDGVICRACKETLTEQEELPATGHTEIVDKAVEAGCTSTGLTEGKHCDVCGEVLVAQKEIPVLGHSTENGTCERCGEEIGGTVEPIEVTFELGANGSASHNDGTNQTTYSETVDGYTLSITGGTNMYTGARDANGNSCIKLGTSSTIGSFTFTVPEDVTEVIIHIGKYKGNASKITVNGTAYTLTNSSNAGAYDVITVDTTTTKTITLTTVSGGVRAMVNSIVFKGGETTGSGEGGDSTEPAEGQWELVTDVSTLSAGDQIVIVASNSNYALSTTQNNNNRGQASVTKGTGTVTFDEDVQIITLEAGTVTGTFAFNTGSGYLYAASSSSNNLKTQTTNNANGSWKITISTDGVASIVAQGSNTRNTMQYNSGSSLFSCYASASQQSISIYVLE